MSYHASYSTSEGAFCNKLVFGDNLLALKALEKDFSGKVKCVFIDPPYNTGSAFAHYDDGLEHSIWLGLMRDRLEIIARLLSDEGSLWVTIDDNEVHYLKIVCDEIFGRNNFVSSFAWEKDKGRRNDTDVSSSHDHILLFAKNRDVWRKVRNPLPRTEAQKARYKIQTMTQEECGCRGITVQRRAVAKRYCIRSLFLRAGWLLPLRGIIGDFQRRILRKRGRRVGFILVLMAMECRSSKDTLLMFRMVSCRELGGLQRRQGRISPQKEIIFVNCCLILNHSPHQSPKSFFV